MPEKTAQRAHFMQTDGGLHATPSVVVCRKCRERRFAAAISRR
jgi:hypothetical protein